MYKTLFELNLSTLYGWYDKNCANGYLYLKNIELSLKNNVFSPQKEAGIQLKKT